MLALVLALVLALAIERALVSGPSLIGRGRGMHISSDLDSPAMAILRSSHKAGKTKP